MRLTKTVILLAFSVSLLFIFCAVSSADVTVSDFFFPTPLPTAEPTPTPTLPGMEIPEDYVIQEEDPQKCFVGMKYVAEASTERFLTKFKLSSGCTAADCAQYLRGNASQELISTVSSAMNKADENTLPRMLLRLAADYPVYGPVSYTECGEVPLMPDGYFLPSALNFNLHGLVTSDAPITSVTAAITHSSRSGGGVYPYIQTVTFNPADNVTCYDLDTVGKTLEGKSMNNLVNFLALSDGEQKITISATTTEQTEPVELVSRSFKIGNANWMQLDASFFNDNYSQALAFFQGKTERFLFKYHWREPNTVKITLDSDWRSTYTVEDEFGRVHVDAQPYFEKARSYLYSTYIRVSGGRHDSGVIPLRKLITANDGSMITRFTNTKKYVSHHSLGTAVDLNAHILPNKQIMPNKNRIFDAVANHTTYNGIMTSDSGQKYYDFTYDGVYKECFYDVPAELMNYLLYELGFYRAGFRWGYYFKTPDSMHFTLTESRREFFEEGPYAMRKVFEYIDE